MASIPPHPSPRAELEQYATPADLAAPLLFEARSLGDIEGKRVLDLGCGTGVLAIAAALLGASHVTAVEVDTAAVEVARKQATRLGVTIEWVEADVRTWKGVADTVVMNPPFGAQVKHADRPFLDAAMESAPVVYTLHHAPTRNFVEAYARERGFTQTHAWALRFALAQQYRHHERAVEWIDVVALRLTKER